MDWNALKTLLKIAGSGTLAGAATQLGVNHSTVYRRLQALEKDMGVRLLEQKGNRYMLTPVGEEVVAIGQQIEDRYNQIERLAMGRDFQPRGHVRLTAPFNLASRFIPEALRQFRLDYPDISIEILASNQEINMNSRVADIAVRATASPPEFLVGRKVARFAWGLFASTEYARKFPSPLTIDDLKLHPLIGGAGVMLALPAFVWLEKNFPDRIRSRCDELTAMSCMAEAGHGIALLPMDQSRPGISCLLQLDQIPPSDIWILTHPDLKKVERIRLVMTALTDYFSGLEISVPAVT